MVDNDLIRCFFENGVRSEKTYRSWTVKQGKKEMADNAMVRCFFGNS